MVESHSVRRVDSNETVCTVVVSHRLCWGCAECDIVEYGVGNSLVRNDEVGLSCLDAFSLFEEHCGAADVVVFADESLRLVEAEVERYGEGVPVFAAQRANQSDGSVRNVARRRYEGLVFVDDIYYRAHTVLVDNGNALRGVVWIGYARKVYARALMRRLVVGRRVAVVGVDVARSHYEVLYSYPVSKVIVVGAGVNLLRHHHILANAVGYDEVVGICVCRSLQLG